MEIGHKIKKIRELKNYTQEYMADRLDISQSQYSRLEKDESELTIAQLERIAKVFEMKTEDVLTFDEKYVLNNYGEIKGAQLLMNSTQNLFPEKLITLYEDKIKLLEEKILFLEKLHKN